MSAFWRTLVKPDFDDDPEKSLIAKAANILQIGEFQLIQLAYHAWHGCDMQSDELDRLFAPYMLHNDVTPWMRHYARSIIGGFERGKIDIDDPAFHRYDNDYVSKAPHGLRPFIIACVVVSLVVFGSLWISQLSIEEGGSVFPPYFERNIIE